MRTFTTTMFSVVAVGVAAGGCGHFSKHEAITPVRDASTVAMAPVTTSSLSPVDSTEAKKAFCGVYEQEVKKTDDTAKRFAAASAGDEQHPQTNWGDQDHWLSDMASDASIIYGYAADTVQAQITSSLPGDLSVKAKDFVAALRKLGDLYGQQEAVAKLKDVTKNEYGPAADSIDKLCEGN